MKLLHESKMVAAALLQRVVRGHWGRRKHQVLHTEVTVAKKHASARVLQDLVRGYLGRRVYVKEVVQVDQSLRYNQREEAATNMQRTFRGHRGRRKAEARSHRIRQQIQSDYESAQSQAQKQLVRDFERRKAAEVADKIRGDEEWRRRVREDTARRNEEWRLAIKAEQNEVLASLVRGGLMFQGTGKLLNHCSLKAKATLCGLAEKLFLQGGVSQHRVLQQCSAEEMQRWVLDNSVILGWIEEATRNTTDALDAICGKGSSSKFRGISFDELAEKLGEAVQEELLPGSCQQLLHRLLLLKGQQEDLELVKFATMSLCAPRVYNKKREMAGSELDVFRTKPPAWMQLATTMSLLTGFGTYSQRPTRMDRVSAVHRMLAIAGDGIVTPREVLGFLVPVYRDVDAMQKATQLMRALHCNAIDRLVEWRATAFLRLWRNQRVAGSKALIPILLQCRRIMLVKGIGLLIEGYNRWVRQEQKEARVSNQRASEVRWYFERLPPQLQRHAEGIIREGFDTVEALLGMDRTDLRMCGVPVVDCKSMLLTMAKLNVHADEMTDSYGGFKPGSYYQEREMDRMEALMEDPSFSEATTPRGGEEESQSMELPDGEASLLDSVFSEVRFVTSGGRKGTKWLPFSGSVVEHTVDLLSRLDGCEGLALCETIALAGPNSMGRSTVGHWQLKQGAIRGGYVPMGSASKLCNKVLAKGIKAQGEQILAEFVPATRQGKKAVMPRAEALTEPQLRHFVSKRWNGAHGILRVAPTPGDLLLVTWDAGSTQLGVYEWPEVVRYKGTDTTKEAKPVAMRDVLAEALEIIMTITEHLAHGECDIRKLALVVNRTAAGMMLLAATCFKFDP